MHYKTNRAYYSRNRNTHYVPITNIEIVFIFTVSYHLPILILSIEGEAPVAGPALVITDMPGFGFAYMKSEELLRCQEITKLYLTKRGSNLKRVLLLLDARHGLKVGDEQFFRDLFSTTASTLNGEKKSVSNSFS